MIPKLHFIIHKISLNLYTRAINRKEKNDEFVQIPFVIFPDHLLAKLLDNTKKK